MRGTDQMQETRLYKKSDNTPDHRITPASIGVAKRSGHHSRIE